MSVVRPHPFRRLSARARIGISVLLFLLGVAIHRHQHVEAETDRAPHGTLSFALRANGLAGQRMRASWRPETQRAVRSNFTLDIAFSVVWTHAIALATAWAREQFQGTSQASLAFVGTLLTWLQWPAAIMALGKDILSLLLLHRHGQQEPARFSRWLTLGEVGAKSLGLLYAGGGVIVVIRRYVPGVQRGS